MRRLSDALGNAFVVFVVLFLFVGFCLAASGLFLGLCYLVGLGPETAR